MKDLADGPSQTLTITEVTPTTHHATPQRTILAHKNTTVSSDWMEVDLSGAMGRWVASGRHQVMVEVSCSTCQGSLYSMSHLPEHRSFIVVTTQQPQVRKRRSTQECPSLWGGGCCRASITVSVEEMGWDDWWVQPQSFTFYYCHGACQSTAASANAEGISRYNNLLQMLVMRQAPGSSLQESLAPCCAPTSYSSMRVLYRLSEERVVQRDIPNLLVESCGCND
ncbi:inhibin beta A chain-like [Homarus americanus]|nr:inhibin beta A chain-like [Homarus americanus]